jgi:alkanesulfonate monooxygenase SsuD/methylene tetrahydromethanopterin reductase-like flavin-dependent oxidoreductase (luciferase family)
MMDVGLSLLFQDDDYLRAETDAPVGIRDQEVYKRERALAKLAEPLGYSSLWGVEHHFTGYAMVPDVLQLLAYMAGQTTHIRLGTMVIVLPWHQPVRVADAVAMLDNLSDGRCVLGIGRGLGRIEFDGFDVPMDESRTRFIESAELILDGLEQGYVEYDGQHFKQEKRWIRPTPVRSFRGRAYASAVSPESLGIMARLGVGLLIVPQKPWDTIIGEVNTYKETYREVNGVEAPEPIVVNQVFCDEDAGRARDLGEEYIGKYYASVMKHYELTGQHFAQTKGYEYYEKASAQLQKHSADEASHWYADLQCYGTPEQCVERVAYLKEQIGCSEFLGMLSFSGMSFAEASRNVHLFADKVMPRLKDFGVQPEKATQVGVSFPAAF